MSKNNRASQPPMAVLNVTYEGRSANLPGPVDARLGDDEIRRIAVEVIRGGDCHGLHVATLGADAFRHFVVDRFDGPGRETRIYLRPKVPFGGRG